MKVNIVATIPNVTHALEKIIQEKAVNSGIIHDVNYSIYVEISSKTQNSICAVTNGSEYTYSEDTLFSIYKDTANEEDYFIPFFLFAVGINDELSNIFSVIISQYNKNGKIIVDDMEGFVKKINAVFKSCAQNFEIENNKLVPEIMQHFYNSRMITENPELADLDGKPNFTLFTS